MDIPAYLEEEYRAYANRFGTNPRGEELDGSEQDEWDRLADELDGIKSTNQYLRQQEDAYIDDIVAEQYIQAITDEDFYDRFISELDRKFFVEQNHQITIPQ